MSEGSNLDGQAAGLPVHFIVITKSGTSGKMGCYKKRHSSETFAIYLA
ncbi:hypothetical protein [Staphylococcus debuckii]|nr:hypothetical protein [Staphylococcus debuckii]